MTRRLLALFAISTILLSISLPPASAHKGGDIIVWGGMGGYGPSVISSGGKKRGSIVLLGRRKRSTAAAAEPQVTFYKLVPAVQL